MDIKQLHHYFLSCSGASTDTRKIQIDDMFFALKGENFNGNEYAAQAIEMGAKFAVIDEPLHKKNDSYLLVKDVLRALQDLARFHRQHLNTKVISLTGSNGKTTTKELINSVLVKKYDTIATIGNLNNHIGVPLTLLRIKPSTEIAIVEMGANHLKEIEFLCSIAQPDYGLVTNFGKAHLEGFGSVEGVIKGKSELYEYLITNEKTVIVDAENSRQMEVINSHSKSHKIEVIKVKRDIVLIDSTANLKIDYDGEIFETTMSGAYNFPNIKYAMTLGELFHIAKSDIISAVEEYVPNNNRSQIIKKDSNEFVLDAYNANPSSMVAALDSFDKKSAELKIAILGDMFELGATAHSEHQFIAEYASSKNIDKIFLVGKNFYSVDSQNIKIRKFESFDELCASLVEKRIRNSTILVKGSRGMALERLLDVM